MYPVQSDGQGERTTAIATHLHIAQKNAFSVPTVVLEHTLAARSTTTENGH